MYLSLGFCVYKMEQVTFAKYTTVTRLDRLLCWIADYKEREADNLMYSQQTCFDVDARAEFRATYLRCRDVF